PQQVISMPPTVQEEDPWYKQEPEPLPLTINPLTGLPRPEGMLPGQRPVAVMVATNQRALPQRGLAAADVIYEMVTEAGIPRLMAVYADYRTVPQVGPVRSTRDQFVQLALPQNFILAHIGSSVYGQNLLQVKKYKTLDGINLGTMAFLFDRERLVTRYGNQGSEYCWFTDAGLLWAGMERLDVLTSGDEHALFRFAKTPAVPATSAYYVRVKYSAVGNTSFNYDETTGLYNKNMLDMPHADEDGTRLSYTNVLVLNIKTGLKVDALLPDFDFTGGEGIYFTAGGATPVQWHKGPPESPLRIATKDGTMLEVQPGKTFIAFAPAGTTTFEAVAYAPKELPASSSPPPASASLPQSTPVPEPPVE
ncbi:DUF3048 domain-containing protein, partial [Ruminococcaceae bacterium OttesenSCG-928-A16]|nr:DUF3048 domain-containing protein [Ruminococcaceae bacterium OttesenSCG-928-A16]